LEISAALALEAYLKYVKAFFNIRGETHIEQAAEENV
jgi:hypothetical protein